MAPNKEKDFKVTSGHIKGSLIPSTKEFLEYLSSDIGIPITELIRMIQGSNNPQIQIKTLL